MLSDTRKKWVLPSFPVKVLREVKRVSDRPAYRVEGWETGAKRPSGMSLKLLTIVQKHGLKIPS
ncbi:hypothetical protein B1757_03490 [Acidithiobacillus marinus]|uniref:Uncharacterized protein n=1 Tax=Acidithiobacillus marinus TaxID=187490 RepID=A0A2I1DP73_9PROT|nr:hypothetical protein B1757_03490 [Acidithiobacillus marinus]